MFVRSQLKLASPGVGIDCTKSTKHERKHEMLYITKTALHYKLALAPSSPNLCFTTIVLHHSHDAKSKDQTYETSMTLTTNVSAWNYADILFYTFLEDNG